MLNIFHFQDPACSWATLRMQLSAPLYTLAAVSKNIPVA